MGFETGDVQCIINGITDFGFWYEAGGSDHLMALLSRIHDCSWFAVEGVPGCFESQRGALAGSSLGDTVFLMAFSRVLCAVERNLSAAGALPDIGYDMGSELKGIMRSLGWSEDAGLSPATVAFVDDAAQSLTAKAEDLIPCVRLVMSIYQRTFAQYLLTVNYS